MTAQRWNHGYDEILAEITGATGITFETFNSGGGCMIVEGRLEAGLWLWITDVDPGLTCLPRRRAYEADGIDVGWMITIHPTADDDPASPAAADGGTTIASVTHHSATAEQLPALVILALQSVATHAHHDIDRDHHRTTCGITRW